MSDASPRRGPWRTVVVLLALQAVAVGVYLVKDRAAPRPDAQVLFDVVDEPAPVLTLERPGARMEPSAGRGPLVLHLWATWCEPCREELPSLLALDARAAQVTLVAASLDENWAVIEHYFEGDAPPVVWRVATGRELAERETLPTTLIVRDGRVVARIAGSRSWSQPAFEELLSPARGAR